MTNLRLLNNLYKYRRYIQHNAWHELRYRYAGTSMGILWNLISPLCEILIYTVVFSVLFSKEVRGNSYALYITSGILPWRAFAETISQGSSAFSQNSIYLRRLAIPTEIFVAKVALTSLLLLYIYLGLVLPISIIFSEHVGWGVLFLPIIALLLQGLAFGMGLALANLQTLFPDIKQVLQFLLPMWSWTMPIYYPDTIIPKNNLYWLYLNPPYAFIESTRNLILENQIPSINVWVIMVAWICFFMWLGATVNRQLQNEVRDTI